MSTGHFIQPDKSLADLADPAARLNIKIHSGYNAVREMGRLIGTNPMFDDVIARIRSVDLPYEDQCSALYYFDIARAMRDFAGQFSRVVEVGVFMGGSSAILAGCSETCDFDLDMVDINEAYLLFAYERIRRTFPAAAERVRLFHGDLASYVRNVMMADPAGGYIVHHDGAHNFDQVVRDLASLSFAREKLFAVICQDTHLRGAIQYMNFVDLAICAVFGNEVQYIPIGSAYDKTDVRTAPNRFEGNYFMAGAPEGMIIPMAANAFHYPHPNLKIEDFLPEPAVPEGVS